MKYKVETQHGKEIEFSFNDLVFEDNIRLYGLESTIKDQGRGCIYERGVVERGGYEVYADVVMVE